MPDTATTASPHQPAPGLGPLLGLGPLEAAIMDAAWAAGDWQSITTIRASLDYPRVAHTTVATVAGVLCGKQLLERTRARPGEAGRARAWLYRAACPLTVHLGVRIAALLDQSPDPAATLACALASAPAGPRPGITVHTSASALQRTDCAHLCS